MKNQRQVYKIRGAEGEGRRDFLALENFSLNVSEGEFVSITPSKPSSGGRKP